MHIIIAAFRFGIILRNRILPSASHFWKQRKEAGAAGSHGLETDGRTRCRLSVILDEKLEPVCRSAVRMKTSVRQHIHVSTRTWKFPIHISFRPIHEQVPKYVWDGSYLCLGSSLYFFLFLRDVMCWRVTFSPLCYLPLDILSLLSALSADTSSTPYEKGGLIVPFMDGLFLFTNRQYPFTNRRLPIHGTVPFMNGHFQFINRQ